MNTIHTLVLVGHVLISVMIIVLVLLQRGKGAEAGAAFGAGASGTVFGAKGSANFLSRSTAVLATLFFVSSLGLAYLGAQRPAPGSLMDQALSPETGISDVLPVAGEDTGGLEELPTLPETGVPDDASESGTDNQDSAPGESASGDSGQ